MRRSRRLIAIVTACFAVLGLGFVVAVASDSLPGGESDDALFEMDLRLDFDMSQVFAWIILLLALAGAVLLAMGMGRPRPRKEGSRRSYIALLVGLIIFVLAYRWVRPAAEALLGEASDTVEAVEDAPGAGGGATGAWLFSVILAAVVAAALTRIGLSLRSGDLPFQAEPESVEVASPRGSGRPRASTLALGGDPRSRVLGAYDEFEAGLASVGEPRPVHETTRHHAVRVGRSIGLDRGMIDTLVAKHLAARFDRAEPDEADARVAEESSRRLRDGLGA